MALMEGKPAAMNHLITVAFSSNSDLGPICGTGMWVIRVEGRKIAEFEEDKENLARAYVKNFSDGSEDLDIAG